MPIGSTCAQALWTSPSDSPQARALEYVAERSAGGPIDLTLRVTLNFHPDRFANGTPILAALAADGIYRSQFETGTSNGGLTAHAGGDRWRWESRIFRGAYDTAGPAERPKYGALNYRRRATGGSPRFGSAHLRLRPEILMRSTAPAGNCCASNCRRSHSAPSMRTSWLVATPDWGAVNPVGER